MKFYVTDKYEIIDPQGGFDSLTAAQQTDVYYDAVDVYEKNMGRSTSPGWPKVVVRKGNDKDSLGTVSS